MVSFSLAADGPARLEILDVRGRVIERRSVGGMGPGQHRLAIGEGKPMAPGVYMIRLLQGDQELRVRSVLLP
jgi:hypothetical protein